MTDTAASTVAAKSGATFDYIIAGGGTAGCVLANRLSADPRNTVLLIEAGPWDRNPFYRIPVMGVQLYLWDYNNWNFRTDPEPGLNGRQITWPRGRVIGGSSSMNGMIWTRGAHSDYDRWAQLGLTQWSFDKCLPYFKALENYEPGGNEWRGGAGPLRVGRQESRHPLFDAFIRANQQAGVPYNPDFNGADLDGVGRYDTNIVGGQRWSTARAYLEPARSRPNLAVVTQVMVERVVLDGTRACGITVRGADGPVTYRANREVILASGAIGSPVILQHSGIGRADDLSAAGVTVRHHLPGVGHNLQDHLNMTFHYESLVEDMYFHASRFDRAMAMMFNAYVRKKGKGAIVPHNCGAFLKSDPAKATPDLQIHYLASGLKSRSLRAPFQRALSGTPYGFMSHICHLHPDSRGSITPRSSDPLAAPRIIGNYLTAPADKVAMRAGFRWLETIFAQPAFDGLRKRRVIPGEDVRSDDEVDHWIASNASTVFHPVGTCKMGLDDSAVVDERLRVRGIDGLRVIDASIMPLLISANTHAPTIMIAERGSEWILDDAKTALSTAA
jgi:choline dehydrogenase